MNNFQRKTFGKILLENICLIFQRETANLIDIRNKTTFLCQFPIKFHPKNPKIDKIIYRRNDKNNKIYDFSSYTFPLILFFLFSLLFSQFFDMYKVYCKNKMVTNNFIFIKMNNFEISIDIYI